MGSEEFIHAQQLLGRVLDNKFRLRSCIGIGGSGAVYKADQIALGRSVAVKILAEKLSRDSRLVKRFHDEALAASRLNHPNTISVIDYGQSSDGLLYLAMEYLRGPTLSHMVATAHPLPVPRILGIILQVLAGLEEAHLAGVIHADVKADNVIVDQSRTGQDQVKVVDFGIARLINAPRDGEDRNVCGTPEYMAPEVIAGTPPSIASDLYSCGIVLYELLVGKTPFVGGTAVDVLTRQLKTEPTPASRSRPIPAELEAVLARALRKKPHDRFADAAEMRGALEAVLTRSRRSSASLDGYVTCPSCGQPASPRFRFCPECGQPLAWQPTTLEFETPSVSSPAIRWPLTGPLLVGRDRALAQVADYLLGKTPAPALLLIGGPGSGRSALLSAAYQRVAEPEKITIFQADPDPTGLASTFYPLRALVATMLELPPICTADDLEEAILGRGLFDRDVPGFFELFGHPSSLAELDQSVRRREIVASTTRLLRAEALRGPTAVVFEDLDRVDLASADTLRHIAERSTGAVRLIVTLDATAAHHWPSECLRVALDPLTTDDLRGLAAGPNGPHPGQLAELTGGIPAHVEHLMRYLAEGGAVEHVPATVADVVAARIATLPRDTLIALQAIAVYGRQVTIDVARRTANLDAPLEDALELAIQRGLIEQRDELLRYPSVLVRDVVYDATPAHVRRQLHAVALKQLVAAGPAELGHHHQAAGHRLEAAAFLNQAGDLAVAQLDDAGATQLYQRALTESRGALANGDLPPADLVAISVKLAASLRATGELALARGVLHESETWGDQGPLLTAKFLIISGQLAVAENKPSNALPLLQKAVGAAIASGDGEVIADAYLQLAAVLVQLGKVRQAANELTEAIDMVTLGEGTHTTRGPRSLWRLALELAQLASADNHLRFAVELGEAALLQALRVDASSGAARARALLAACHDKLGNLDLAEQHQHAAIEASRRSGDRRTTAELLLSSSGSDGSALSVSMEALREARDLAREIGWSEGEARATAPRE